MMPPNPTALPADPGQGSHYWSRRQRKGSMGRTAVPSAPPVRDLGQAAEDRITVEAPARPSSGWVALNDILGAHGILGPYADCAKALLCASRLRRANPRSS